MTEHDETELDDFEVALWIGRKVIEMCDRLQPMAKIVPGSKASWKFEIDDVRFNCVIELAAQPDAHTASTGEPT